MEKHCVNCKQKQTVLTKKKYSEILKLEEPYQVLECTSCNLVFLDPQPSHEELEAIYNNYNNVYDFEATTEYRVQNEYKDRLEFCLSLNLENPSLFDVGSGQGGLLNLFKENGFKVTGNEFSDEAIAFAKKKYDVDIVKKDILDINDNVQYDITHSNHVIEHVSDPTLYIKKIYDMTKEGGYFLMEIPNEFWNSIRYIQILFGLKRGRSVYPSMHHNFFYKKHVIQNILEDAGFKIVKYSGHYSKSKEHNNPVINSLYKLFYSLFANSGKGDIHYFICKK